MKLIGSSRMIGLWLTEITLKKVIQTAFAARSTVGVSIERAHERERF